MPYRFRIFADDRTTGLTRRQVLKMLGSVAPAALVPMIAHGRGGRDRLSPFPVIRCVFWTGLLVGAADYAIGFGIFAAALGTSPLAILQHPASGVLGPAAYRGGTLTAALGIALHFAIALIWSVIYIAAYGALTALRHFTRTTPLISASVMAGVSVWLVMNSIVLPLSQTRPYPISSGLFWVILAGHIPSLGCLSFGAFAVSAECQHNYKS